MQENKLWLIVTSDTIHHEGDERSRTHPGHGYPAYSEEVDRIQRFTDYKEFLYKVEQLLLNKKKYSAYEAKPLIAKLNFTMEIEHA